MTALGAIGHCNAVAELLDQLAERGVKAEWLYLCSSGGTQAGYLLGAKVLGHPFRIVGIAHIEWRGGNRPRIAEVANLAAVLLGLDTFGVGEEEVCNDVNYVGPGFGIVTAAGCEAVALLARAEVSSPSPFAPARPWQGS